jgi:excisionase family DNA binding protein
VSKLLYSTSEVADIFRVNRVTIYRWAKEGKIKAYGIGKHLKIPVSEVTRSLETFGFSQSDIQRVFPAAGDEGVSSHQADTTGKVNGKKRVVAVDDNEEILTFISGIFHKTDLSNTGELFTFSNSLEAALQIGGQRPDVVLLDVRMSGLDGIELAIKIRSIYDDVKIIFMSGYPEENTERMNTLGGYKFLEKPVDHRTLYSVIQDALEA